MKLAIVAVIFASILAGADDSVETKGAWNGRAWSKMDNSMKIAYLRGLSEGDGLCQMTAKASSGWPAALTFGEIAKAVDLFYMEPDNAPVPVLFGALVYVKRKADGGSEAELKQLQADLQRRAQ